MENNALYFSRRAAEERIAAIKADNQNARRAHLELAARYGDLTEAFASPNRADAFQKSLKPLPEDELCARCNSSA